MTDARPDASRRPVARLVLGGLLIALGLLLLAHSFAPRYARGMFATAPNAMVLPRVLLGLWIGLGLVALLADWRGREAAPRPGLPAALALCGIFLAGAVALPFVGFAITITPLAALALWAMGERRPLPLIAATALLGPGLWWLFHHVLLIRLPSILPGGLL